jgi:hypothetical protein
MEARHMLAGGAAGVLANALVHPLDVIRARITVQPVRALRLLVFSLPFLRPTAEPSHHMHVPHHHVSPPLTSRQAYPRTYVGAGDCARHTLQTEGYRALYRGLLPCSIWAFLYIGEEGVRKAGREHA